MNYITTNNNQVNLIMLNANEEIKENYLIGVNDRISFKKFLSLPPDKPSSFRAGGLSRQEADHSTFSRFRSRLSKAAGPDGPLARREAMIHINNILLQEFAKRGLSINEGIAVYARLASGSTPSWRGLRPRR